MSEEKVYFIKDGKTYEIKKDHGGYYDRTGKTINGKLERISGDAIRGFRDSTGSPISLRETKKK